MCALLAIVSGALPVQRAEARSDRVVRVLLAADDEFRTMPGWEETARDALTRAAAPFGADMGIRFSVVRVAGWISSSNDYDLAALHDELPTRIDHDDADMVIGFTGTTRVDQDRYLMKLGHSDTPGRWVLVTARSGEDLPIVLRHELGHAFGVPHVRSMASVMNEDVRSENNRFDPMSAAIIENNIDLDFRSDDPFAGCRLDQLEAVYMEMAGLGNQVADLVALVGDSYRRRGDRDAARRAYRQGLELDPSLVSGRLGLAMIAMDHRNFPEAIRLFEEVRRVETVIPGLDMNLGMAYSDLGQDVNARAAYERALDLDPENPHAMNNLALLYIDAGFTGQAEDLLRAAIEVRPDFMEALNNLGMLYDRQNRPEEAIVAFQAALESTESAVIHRNLATVLLRNGRNTEAREHLEASLRLDPTQKNADQMRVLSSQIR